MTPAADPFYSPPAASLLLRGPSSDHMPLLLSRPLRRTSAGAAVSTNRSCIDASSATSQGSTGVSMMQRCSLPLPSPLNPTAVSLVLCFPSPLRRYLSTSCRRPYRLPAGTLSAQGWGGVVMVLSADAGEWDTPATASTVALPDYLSGCCCQQGLCCSSSYPYSHDTSTPTKLLPAHAVLAPSLSGPVLLTVAVTRSSLVVPVLLWHRQRGRVAWDHAGHAGSQGPSRALSRTRFCSSARSRAKAITGLSFAKHSVALLLQRRILSLLASVLQAIATSLPSKTGTASLQHHKVILLLFSSLLRPSPYLSTTSCSSATTHISPTALPTSSPACAAPPSVTRHNQLGA